MRKWKKRETTGLFLFILAVVSAYAYIRSPVHGPWARIPAGTYTLGSPEGVDTPPRTVTTAGFRMQRTEVTVGQFVRFLNTTRPGNRYASPQIGYRWGRYHALTDRKQPVTYVTYHDAERYAQWAGRKRRGDARLPTPDEWEIAARGGVHGVRFPWGWTDPVEHAQFASDGPNRVAGFAPNLFGLYDMVGNVAEWCVSDDPDTAFALGGSWAERQPELLRVFQRTPFPTSYRDADVGIRVLSEKRAPQD